LKRVETLEAVLTCNGKPQQVRAVINQQVRARIIELREQRKPQSKDAWRSIEKETLDLGRWLSAQVGQPFNSKLPTLIIRQVRR